MTNISIEIGNKMRAEAVELDKKIRAVVPHWNKISMEIGWYGFQMKSKNMFGLLGFEDENAYADSIGMSRSNWFRMVRIAGSFQRVSQDEFLAMSATNADALSRSPLPEEVKTSPEMLEKAASMKSPVFARELLEHRSEHENVPVRELAVSLKIPCYEGQREAILAGLERWREQHDIKDVATSLELLVAEVSDRATFVGFFADSIPRLRKAVELSRNANLSAEELAEQLKAALEEHLLAMKTLTDAIQESRKRAAA